MIPELGILVVAVLGLAFLAWVLACTMSGRYEPIMLVWALLAPLTYCLLAYPLERPVITLHRVVILPLTLLVFILPPVAKGRITPKLAWLAVTWGCFLFGALISLLNAPQNVWLSASRVLIDTFILPLLLAYAVYRSFRVRENLAILHGVVCGVSVYLMVIGAMEVILGRDLLPQPDSIGAWYAGGDTFQLVRANGPFFASGTFSTVGLINVFLLLFLYQAMNGKHPPATRLLHWPGVISGLAVSLMSLTRGILIALLFTLAFEFWRERSLRRRIVVSTCVLSLTGVILLASAKAPTDVASERLSLTNFWARVAQQEQNIRVFLEHPITGAGFGNFANVPKHEFAIQGVTAVGDPHNLLAQLLAETGLLGTLPFVLSQVLVVAAFRQLRRFNPGGGGLVWRYFAMIFTAFWLMNMESGIGYYSELTLWFVFAISVLYRYGAEPAPQAAAAMVPSHFRGRVFASTPTVLGCR